MKKFLIVLLCLGLVGCYTLADFRMENRQNLLKLSIGMTKQEVLDIMGDKTIRDEIITANNPYRSEIIQGKNKTLEVLYYYTDIKTYDAWLGYKGIADDELTPLVFDEGKLIGWGNSFLDTNIQKHEIKLR